MAQSKFTPKPGQVDYTNIRYCPVTNCILKYGNKILLVQRSLELNLYPGYWNGISGFLDDHKNVPDKVFEELSEEAGINEGSIESIKVGKVIVQESDQYNKTWIVFPVLAEVTSDNIKLDWEAKAYKWVSLKEARQLNLLPGFEEVLDELLG
jgi:isopentenyldiphosphate isomerase